jgi:D-alanyl-D-alanine carboxypeptidase/D-alanyl-D-alanine-endopeptidase (penicillin-binding protein 4)
MTHQASHPFCNTLRALCLALLGLSGFASQSFAQTTNWPVATNLADLRQKLTAHVSQPRFEGAVWGIKAVSLETGVVLFEQNPHKLLSPASNSKLYTVALGLDRLGTEHRIRTSLYTQSRPSTEGVLAGDLVVYGRGDPTFNARYHGSLSASLQSLVAAVTNAGVKTIRGALVGDKTFLRGPEYGSGWSWDDALEYYGAELSSLTISDNYSDMTITPGGALGEPAKVRFKPATSCLILSNRTETVAAGERRTVRVFRPIDQNIVYVTGRMPLGEPAFAAEATFPEPAAVFLEYLREELSKAGVKIQGTNQIRDWEAVQANNSLAVSNLVEVAFVESPPMGVIAREIQKPSQNLYTDLLLAYVGEQQRGTQTGTSEDLGITELNRFLRKAGIKSDEVVFEEGSGLSRNNVCTANSTATLLAYMARHPAAKAYEDALPVAGVDGTLRSRMKNTPAAGKLKAKTGTLRWANSLSGYVTSAAGERLAFSIMLNRYYNPAATTSARSELDTVALLLTTFTGKSSETASQ